jgi:hypothetical protein
MRTSLSRPVGLPRRPPQRDHRVDNSAGNPRGFARLLDFPGDCCSAFVAISIMLPRVLMQ